ncbi:hypothetical protein PWT90_07067 [Aphanocladium album]|nr:hypothetical protein PWT90_07067 [Aphanocladium album]
MSFSKFEIILGQTIGQTPNDAVHFQAEHVWTLAFIDRDNYPGTEMWTFSSLELCRTMKASVGFLTPGDTQRSASPIYFSSEVQFVATQQILAILAHAAENRPRLVADRHQLLMGNVHTTLAALLTTTGLVCSQSPTYGKYIFPATETTEPARVGGTAHKTIELPRGLAWGTILPGDHADILRAHQRMSVAQLQELPSVVVRESSGSGHGRIAGYAFTGRDGAVSTLYVNPEFRGKGVAKAVVARMRSSGALLPPSLKNLAGMDCVEAEPIAMAGIERDNVASIATFQPLGAQWLWDVCWLLVDLKRASSNV